MNVSFHSLSSHRTYRNSFMGGGRERVVKVREYWTLETERVRREREGEREKPGHMTSLLADEA